MLNWCRCCGRDLSSDNNDKYCDPCSKEQFKLGKALKEMLELYLPDEGYEKAIQSSKVLDSMKWERLKTPTAGDVRRWRKALNS